MPRKLVAIQSTVNLGIGQGYSVLEIVRSFVKCSGRRVSFKFVGRRPEDIAICYADTTLVNKLLGCCATRGIDEVCAVTWRWQFQNLEVYGMLAHS